MSEIIWRDRKRTIFGLPLSFTVYSLDEERLYIERGFLNKKEDEVRLYRITDVSLDRNFWQRMFGVGTIRCCSGDKSAGDFEITSIKRPREIKEMLSDMVEKQRRERNVIAREFIDDDGVTDTIY